MVDGHTGRVKGTGDSVVVHKRRAIHTCNWDRGSVTPIILLIQHPRVLRPIHTGHPMCIEPD